MAVHVTDSTFDADVLKASGYVLVDFWAEWCGPCRMLAPVLESISKKFAGKLTVAKLNTDENPQASQTYEISSIPCCILFKDGKEVQRIIGFRNEAQFTEELSKTITL
jgi:thioredoxin 1